MTGEQNPKVETQPGTAIDPRRIVVLLGGPSAEHDVSVVSGWAIADALAGAGCSVERMFIDLDGLWWSVPASASPGRPRPGIFDDPLAAGGSGPHSPAQALEALAAQSPRPVVFPGLHGPFGEDGTLQALLEAYEIPYAGAGVAASAVGMDKALYKRMVRGLGIPIVEWEEVTAARWEADRAGVLSDLESFAGRTGEPRLMVKPARMGSSVGMSIAHTAAERGAALDEAFRFDSLVVVERYLNHPRELEMAVLGNDPHALEVYGPGEVFPGHEFYDYVAKYTDGVSETALEAHIDPSLVGQIRESAGAAYAAIGCEGYARVDFLLDGDHLYLNEINTLPGFTPISLFPQLAATGLGGFAEVCLEIVDLAVKRHNGRVRRRLTTADLPR
jgi:D-alanine-D-alanine ligase